MMEEGENIEYINFGESDDNDHQVVDSVVTNLFFERIRIPNLIRNPEIFRIRILFVVRKFSNPHPNIRIRILI